MTQIIQFFSCDKILLFNIEKKIIKKIHNHICVYEKNISHLTNEEIYKHLIIELFTDPLKIYETAEEYETASLILISILQLDGEINFDTPDLDRILNINGICYEDERDQEEEIC